MFTFILIKINIIVSQYFESTQYIGVYSRGDSIGVSVRTCRRMRKHGLDGACAAEHVQFLSGRNLLEKVRDVCP